MQSSYRHLATGARLAAAVIFGLSALATPAAAQFGGLKKKAKAAATNEATPAPPPDAGMIVLTPDVVDQLLSGLKAGQAERDAATKEDTPYGRYKKGQVAYEQAKPKCEAAQPAFYQRAAANPKMLDKYSALTEKMIDAQSKGDMKRQAIYQDSAMAMMDPSCTVKEPEQPKDYYEAERAMEARAETKEIEASGFSRNDMAMIKERAVAILTGSTPPGGASTSEKSAVTAKSAQLKPLLGIREEPAPQAAKPAPAAAPAPAVTPQPSPEMTAAASNMSACMVKNMQTHEAEIEALSKQAEGAQKAGNQQKLMAIADTLQRIQMAGCR
jgi:hypothetical protein